MGKLGFENGKFYFQSTERQPGEAACAEDAGFIYDAETLRWVTRKAVKAVKLRRYADESAELKFKKHFITSYEPPEQILYPDTEVPKSFQIESAWHCLTRSPAYCADEAGLGKTITSVLCMNTVRGKTLITCPPFLKYNWAEEIHRWSVFNGRVVSVIETGDDHERYFNHEVTILPDSLLQSERIQSILRKHKYKWLFIDEAQRYKTDGAKRTTALIGDDTSDDTSISTLAERVVFLSGTPIPNGKPIELYPILSRLAPEAIGWRPMLEYGKTFCAARQVTRHEGKRAVVNWDFQGKSNLTQLGKELRAKFMIRHTKADHLKELGPKTRAVVFLDKPKKAAKLEAKLLKEFTLDELMGEDHKLGDIARYRRQIGEEKLDDAIAYIKELLNSSDEKVVVFAHHIDVVEKIQKAFQTTSYGSLMIRGGMSAKAKAEQVRLFQTKPFFRLIVGNIASIGIGNTLTKAPRAIFVEWSWSVGENEQAEDRIYRMTQEQNVLITYLVHRDSLDERMLRKTLAKEQAINQVLNK